MRLKAFPVIKVLPYKFTKFTDTTFFCGDSSVQRLILILKLDCDRVCSPSTVLPIRNVKVFLVVSKI